MSLEIPRVAILASGDHKEGGGGSTAERVIRDVLEGKVNFTVGLVICNNPPEALNGEPNGVYSRINDLNNEFGLSKDDRIKVVNISGKTHTGPKVGGGMTMAESAAVCKELEDWDTDYVAMLGYMKRVTGVFANKWLWSPEIHPRHVRFGFDQGKYHPDVGVMNNHNAILPFLARYHGQGSHEEAIRRYRAGKLTHTAITWHVAAHDVDAGPIIHSIPVEIDPGDTAETLGAKVQAVEKENTSKVIESHLIFRAQHHRNWGIAA